MKKIVICLFACAIVCTLVSGAYAGKITYDNYTWNGEQNGYSGNNVTFSTDSANPNVTSIIVTLYSGSGYLGSSVTINIPGVHTGTDVYNVGYASGTYDLKFTQNDVAIGGWSVVVKVHPNSGNFRSYTYGAMANPEPTTMLLFGSGLVALGAWKRRNKNPNIVA